MSWNSEELELLGKILHHTDEAILFEYEGEEHWIPKRYVLNSDELDLNDPDEYQEITIPNWIAYEKEMI